MGIMTPAHRAPENLAGMMYRVGTLPGLRFGSPALDFAQWGKPYSHSGFMQTKWPGIIYSNRDLPRSQPAAVEAMELEGETDAM